MRTGRGGLPAIGIVLSLVAVTGCETTTTMTATSPPKLTSVRMVTDTIGWAATKSQVLRTTDGGKHWIVVTPSAASPLRSTFFLDATAAWVEAGAGNLADEALPLDTVFRTTDGGKHWQRGVAARGLGSLTFADRQRGWSVLSVAIGMNQHVSSLQTSADGGMHWTEVASSEGQLDRACDIAGATFLTASTMWIAGSCPPISSGVSLLAVSRDGGRTFRPQRFPFPPPGDPRAECPCEGRAPQFFSGKDGIFVLHYGVTQYNPIGKTMVYVSHDAGTTWVARPTALWYDAPTEFNDVNTGWQLDGTGSTLYHTRDGQTWKPIATNPSLGQHVAIQFIDEQNGWALLLPESSSPLPSLMRTRDGGQNWQLLIGPGTQPVTRLAITCTLPIDGLAPDSEPATQVGFVTFPGAHVGIDPSGAFTYDQARWRFTTVTAPPLSGWGGSSYSRPLARWLPVSSRLVSPDGQAYAWTEAVAPGPESDPTGTRIHVVDGRRGVDRAITAPPSSLEAIAFTPEGIYAVNEIFSPVGFEIRSGLWLVDPRTGATTEISKDDSQTWQLVTNDAAWGTDLESTLPRDGPQVAMPTARLLRLDLRSRKLEAWSMPANGRAEVVGADSSGHPLVEVSSASTPNAEKLWLVSAADQATLIASVERPGAFHPVADRHGLWFVGDGGIFLYAATTGARRVAAVGGFPAGPCV